MIHRKMKSSRAPKQSLKSVTGSTKMSPGDSAVAGGSSGYESLHERSEGSAATHLITWGNASPHSCFQLRLMRARASYLHYSGVLILLRYICAALGVSPISNGMLACGCADAMPPEVERSALPSVGIVLRRQPITESSVS